MNALNRLSAEADRRRDAVVVGVAVGEERTKVRAFGQAHQLAYSLLVDSDFALTDALGERRVPTTLVVDRQGRIVFRGGALDAASLAAFRDTVSSTP
jgi:peroxiredoxin